MSPLLFRGPWFVGREEGRQYALKLLCVVCFLSLCMCVHADRKIIKLTCVVIYCTTKTSRLRYIAHATHNTSERARATTSFDIHSARLFADDTVDGVVLFRDDRWRQNQII